MALTVETIPGTTHILTAADDGKLLRFTNSSTITVTANETNTTGFEVLLYQAGAGQVQVEVGGTAEFLEERAPFTRGTNAILHTTCPEDGKYKFSGEFASAAFLSLINIAGGAPPTVNDDATLGYSVGSAWYFGSTIYDCTDASVGAAVWSQRFAVDNELIAAADSTGILTGGEVTINANPLLVDIAAGTGVIINWTDPANPTRTYVSWSAFTGESIPNLATQFTSMYIDDVGALTKESGVTPTPNQERNRIYLQAVVHQSGTQVDSISTGSTPAYEAMAALYDYVRFLGPLNRQNDYSANGVNLQIDKAAGQTCLPYINRAIDPQNPTIKTDPAQSPVPSIVYTYRDGASGYTFTTPATVVDPGFWDDGTGTLNTVTPNNWTVQLIYFFGQSEATTIVYGQQEYGSQAAAEAAVGLVIDKSPLLDNATRVTALVVQEGATDLSDPAQASFIDVDPNHR